MLAHAGSGFSRGSRSGSRGLRRAGAVTLAIAALGLVGCNNAGEGALTGAGLGALGGLAIGSLTGSAGAGAAIGAISGGIGGAVIGDQNERNRQNARYQGGYSYEGSRGSYDRGYEQGYRDAQQRDQGGYYGDPDGYR